VNGKYGQFGIILDGWPAKPLQFCFEDFVMDPKSYSNHEFLRYAPLGRGKGALNGLDDILETIKFRRLKLARQFKNEGVSEAEIEAKVKSALKKDGIEVEKLMGANPEDAAFLAKRKDQIDKLLRYADDKLEGDEVLKIEQYLAAYPEDAVVVEIRKYEKFREQLEEFYGGLRWHALRIQRRYPNIKWGGVDDFLNETVRKCLEKIGQFKTDPDAGLDGQKKMLKAWVVKTMDNLFKDKIGSYEETMREDKPLGGAETTNQNSQDDIQLETDKKQASGGKFWREEEDNPEGMIGEFKRKDLWEKINKHMNAEEERQFMESIKHDPKATNFVKKRKTIRRLVIGQYPPWLDPGDTKGNPERKILFEEKVLPCLELFSEDEQEMLYEKWDKARYVEMANKRGINQDTFYSRYKKVLATFKDCLGPFSELVQI
jgi:DNA-directed RNA polymerase specialized sigma24 family protein